MKEQIDAVKKLFDLESQRWNGLYSKGLPRLGSDQNFVSRLNTVQSLIKNEKGKLLDLGCGPGVSSLALCHSGITSLMGVDMASKMIELAKKNAEKAHLNIQTDFKQAVGDKMDFPTESFDIVTAMGVLEYVDNPNAFLSEIVRVTARKGTIVITVPHQLSPFRLWEEAVEKTIRPLGRLVKYQLLNRRQPTLPAVRHEAYSYKSLSELSKTHGLKVEDYSYCTICAPSLETLFPVGGWLSRWLDDQENKTPYRWLGTNLIMKWKKVST